MLKKLISTLIITGTLVSSAFALEVETKMFHGLGHQINMVFDTTNHLGQNRDNWVGVYKKGASNDWNNVLKWAWLKDLKQQMTPDDFNNKQRVFSNTLDLEAGTYDFRIFLNNSFETFNSLEFTIEGDYFEEQASIEITLNDTSMMINVNKESYAYNTWVGIYKKGASNDWGNVQKWKWLRSDMNHRLSSLGLEEGIYEARLFYNNSYILEAEYEFELSTDVFHKRQVWDVNDEFSRIYISGYNLREINIGVSLTDWVGIFKSGSQKTLENLVAWNYISYEDKGNVLPLLPQIYNRELLENGTYDMVYFKDNSYRQIGETGSLIVKID